MYFKNMYPRDNLQIDLDQAIECIGVYRCHFVPVAQPIYPWVSV